MADYGFSINLDIKKAAWLDHPAERWNAGLERAGLRFRNQLTISRYPPAPPLSTYVRTGTLAHKANFRITEVGKSMEFGSTSYLKFLLMPAKTVMHWQGKRKEVLDAMKSGFKFGIVKWDKANDRGPAGDGE
jgi:hypothetical protein